MQPGTVGDVCYSLYPGYWSPCFEECVLLEILPDDKVKVKTESGKIIETHKGNFLAYLNQPQKNIQLKLFD